MPVRAQQAISGGASGMPGVNCGACSREVLRPQHGRCGCQVRRGPETRNWVQQGLNPVLPAEACYFDWS